MELFDLNSLKKEAVDGRSSPIPPFPSQTISGERSRANAERQMKDGVEMEETAWAELVRCAVELGIQDIPQPLGEGR